MAETQTTNKYEFQAEITKLLHLLAYSVYTHKDIFLRELISNASDALNKIRFIQLSNQDIVDKDAELKIDISLNEEKNILIISDTGVGMSKDELINNIGVIARSGTMEFVKHLTGDKKKDMDIIGQFGVGFYSVFMVADEVTIYTRSYEAESKGYIWKSDGKGSFTVEESEGVTNRGTKIEIQLKEDEKEYVEKQKVESIIRKYSSFIGFPININGENFQTGKALWAQPPSQIEEEEYKNFFSFIGGGEEYLTHLHISSDAPISVKGIFYVPTTNVEKFGMVAKTPVDVSLYCQRVLIQENCEDIMPEYLRFMKGVVDSDDLPLNVSRETIQNNRLFIKIKKIIVNKILDHLIKIGDNDKEKYQKFWNEFGKIIKEGFTYEMDSGDRLLKLLRFNTSKCENAEQLVSLKEYIERKDVEQNDIYFALGRDRTEIEKSPHLEIFKTKGIEVLYLYEPVDEFILTNYIREYEGMKVKSVDQADIKLDKSEDAVKSEEDKKKSEEFINTVKEVLKDNVQDVVESNRLTSSPAALLNPNDAASSSMQKILKAVNKDFKSSKKILELNMEHNLVKNMMKLKDDEASKDRFNDMIMHLYENCSLIDGEEIDMKAYTERSFRIMNDYIEK